MTSYSVRLYSGRSDELRNRYIECDRKEMPVMLARFVLDYLEDAPYPGAIQAIALAGRDTLMYIITLRNDTVDVYRHVFRGNKADIQE